MTHDTHAPVPTPGSPAPGALPSAPDEAAGAPADGVVPVSLRAILLGSGPRFLRDGFGPVLAFYVGWKLAGLAVGIGLSTLVGLAMYRVARREERTGALVKLAVASVILQAVIGLVSGSERVYLAQPVLINGAIGIAFLASAFTRRPIIGILAGESYPFPPEVRDSETFRRVFARASIVWGIYQLARSGIRLLILSQTSVDAYVVVNFLTGVPLMSGMFAWTAWYSVRGFRRSEEWGGAIADLDTAALLAGQSEGGSDPAAPGPAVAPA